MDFTKIIQRLKGQSRKLVHLYSFLVLFWIIITHYLEVNPFVAGDFVFYHVMKILTGFLWDVQELLDLWA